MTKIVSTSTAKIVARSLPLMEERRDALEAAMRRYMGRSGPYDPSKGRHELTTRTLFDMLFDHARGIDAAGGIAATGQHGERHRQLAIGGEHYSSFGDGLMPIMKDVLGTEAAPPLLSAWGDAYWAITRHVAAQPAAMAA